MKSLWSKRWFKVTSVSAVLFALLVLALCVTYLILRTNIHTVIPGEFYRSAQLSGPEFTVVIKEDGIHSILNLRGAHPKKMWYQSEIATAKEFGVKHVDLHMNAYSLPKPAVLRQLVHLLQTMPKPLLFHCEGGADRTGLASAIVVLLNNGSYKQAAAQISLRYFVIHSDSIGLLVLPYYHRWLLAHHYPHSSRKLFLQWVDQLTSWKAI